MRYRCAGPRFGWVPRCPECGCYYDYYPSGEYGRRFGGYGRGRFMGEYLPREVESEGHPYGYRMKRHFYESFQEITKEEKKSMLKEELEEIEEEISEIKEELKKLESED